MRKANLYAAGRDVTPYGMRVRGHRQARTASCAELEDRCGYRARRAEIAAFNAGTPSCKRGIALTPVKFGISFTLPHMNQAGALVNVYQDGSCCSITAAPRWGRVCS